MPGMNFIPIVQVVLVRRVTVDFVAFFLPTELTYNTDTSTNVPSASDSKNLSV